MIGEEIIKERSKIEKALAQGILTEDDFKKLALDLCLKSGCSKSQMEICGNDGPCCDVGSEE